MLLQKLKKIAAAVAAAVVVAAAAAAAVDVVDAVYNVILLEPLQLLLRKKSLFWGIHK